MPQKSKFWRYLFISISVLLGVFFLIILAYFIYFSIKLKYGNNEDIQNITKKYENNFSTAINKDAPTDTTDYLKLIRNTNPTKGEKDAKVTILAFIDFECPYCQQNYETFNYIQEKYSPIIRVIFKQLPLVDLHPNSIKPALASACANEQNKFWEYYKILFEKQKYDNESLLSYSQIIGLNKTKFENCITSQKYLKDIEQDVTDAVTIGLRGTPSYIINGQIIEGSITKEDWDQIIIKNLNN